VGDALIRYGLGAVKGTGQQAIEAIVAAREGRGTGPAFQEPVRLLPPRRPQRVNKRTVEALIKAGAFDSLQLNRAALAAAIDLGFEFAAAHEANLNQGGLFDMLDDAGSSTQEPELPSHALGRQGAPDVREDRHRLLPVGPPVRRGEREVRQFARRPLAELVDSREPQLLAGIVGDLRIINGQRGKLALFKLDDKSAGLDGAPTRR
jgi:DNA polymerase-3 subunit alpha